MKFKFTKIACAALAAAMSFTMTACGPMGGEIIDKVDKTKIQLNVFSYNGGVGSEWLDKVIARFEEDYKDAKFSNGRTGVEVVPDKTKSDVFGNMTTNNNHVIFSEVGNYSQLVTQKSILDISDIMDKPLNELTKTSDTKTLKSKMYDETIDFYSFNDGKIYALPHYSFFSTLTYNKQLMIDKNLYFAKDYDVNGDLDSKFIHAAAEDKSCGPDGKYGTDDDGLPATYTELFELFRMMKNRNVTPITWAGGEMVSGGYVNHLLNNVYLSLAGKDQARLNYTFDSKDKTITIVEKFEGGKAVTKQEKITAENYKKLNSELAKYQAIKVVDTILDNALWQSGDCDSTTTTMLSTQQNYIESYNRGAPVAMIVEGSYWYNEADDAEYIEDTRNRYTDFDAKNDYQILPLPRVYEGTYADVVDKNVGKAVYADQADSLGVINANIAGNNELVELAKTFLAYCYTDESLKEFTETTRVTRSLKYDVDVNKLDDWGKAVWNYTKNADLLLPYSSNSLYLNNRTQQSMHIDNDFWAVNGKNVYSYCKGSATAESYFLEYMARQ